MCCTRLAEIKDALRKNRHLRTIAQICRAICSHLRLLSTMGKKFLNSNISSMSYNVVNFDRYTITAEIGWRVWGTPANFNRFRVLLASLLHRRHSTEVNQTLHDVWPAGRLVDWYTIYTFLGAHAPLTEFCHVQN